VFLVYPLQGIQCSWCDRRYPLQGIQCSCCNHRYPFRALSALVVIADTPFRAFSVLVVIADTPFRAMSSCCHLNSAKQQDRTLRGRGERQHLGRNIFFLLTHKWSNINRKLHFKALMTLGGLRSTEISFEISPTTGRNFGPRPFRRNLLNFVSFWVAQWISFGNYVRNFGLLFHNFFQDFVCCNEISV